MAKRKRLTPAQPDHFGAGIDEGGRAPETKVLDTKALSGPAPIAQVAGEASAHAALAELADVVETARARGLMIELLPLAAIDDRHLVRDRLVQDEEEMAALMSSLRARGQQTPIEVVRLPKPSGGHTHGLISGWRRLTALRRLQAGDEDERFATVRALVSTPETARDAYVAMVEENEVRVNLSHYERARIALQAFHEGVYPSLRTALQGLFGTASRSKRSKIGSFVPLVEALDSVLKYPAAVPEKLGLALAKALQADHEFKSRLGVSLRADPPDSAEAERARLTALLAAWRRGRSGGRGAASEAPPSAPSDAPGPRLTALEPGAVARRLAETRIDAKYDAGAGAGAGRIEISGGGVDAAFFAALQNWLKTR